MKYLITLLAALLISASAFGHGGFKVRDRYTDEHGVPYGAQNPPVLAGNTGAHCMYSAWGCSGAGGSTGPRGYRVPHYGAGVPMGVYGNPCGTSSSVSGGAGVHNGNVSGSVTIAGSRGHCTPTGYHRQGGSVTLGVSPSGQVGVGVGFHSSSSQ